MKRALLLAACLALAGCATTVPQTVTITKTEPVYPPAALYDNGPTCQHGPARTSGTVEDLGHAMAIERNAVTNCMKDREALRNWVSGMKNAEPKQ